jgi:dTDP-4-amino-4,6-dideoxygalactose transaminase
MGDFGCFSFFPSKNLGGFGDGGMVIANSEQLIQDARILRVHGMEPKYFHQVIGGNFRLDALQAAVLRVKLKYLDEWHAQRRENAQRYDEAFRDSPVVTPRAVYADTGAANYHIYNQYIVRLADRDQVRSTLLASGIGCEVYYPLALHQQQCFQGLGYAAGAFPESERAANETLALPIYPEMTDDMQEVVIKAVLKAVS